MCLKKTKRLEIIMKKTCFILLIICSFVATFFGSVSSSAMENTSIVYVGGTGTGNVSTITEGITLAESGSILYIYPGTYTEEIIIDKSLTIAGLHKETTIIQGNGMENVIHINAEDVKVENLTILNSGEYVVSGTEPGGNGSSLFYNKTSEDIKPLDLSTIDVNFSGIYSDYNSTIVSSCIFDDCYTSFYIRNASNSIFDSCYLYNNTNGIYCINVHDVSISNSLFHNNIKCVYIDEVTNVEISLCIFSSNEDTGLLLSETNDSIIHHNIFQNNTFGVIIIENSNNNIFYQNNFIENSIDHARDNCQNFWDNGVVGNYWDDYEGEDLDGDEFGDTPHFIPVISYDYYPLLTKIMQTIADISVSIDAPLSVEKVKGIICIEGSIQSQSALSTVRLRIDNGTWSSVNGTSDWYLMFNTSSIENGFHDIYVSAVNEEGQSQIKHVRFEVDNKIASNENISDDTPGFTLVVLIVSFSLFIYLRKRK